MRSYPCDAAVGAARSSCPWRCVQPSLSRPGNRKRLPEGAISGLLPTQPGRGGPQCPTFLTPLEAVDVAAPEDRQWGGEVALGSDEHVIGLGVRLVTVKLGVVIRDVVLMANLAAVIGEGPVEEVVDFADEANVIINRALVVRRTCQSPVESIHPRA